MPRVPVEENEFITFAAKRINDPKNNSDVMNAGYPFMEQVLQDFYKERGMTQIGRRQGGQMHFDKDGEGRQVNLTIRNLPRQDYTVLIYSYVPSRSRTEREALVAHLRDDPRVLLTEQC